MSKTTQCPECGADVTFSHPASLLSVCGFCRSVLARRDVDFERIGKVAVVADVASPLARHLRGGAFGGFTVVGRLQLDHGAGTWNEWYLGLDNGRWLWLAEVQGRYYLTAPVGEVAAVPPFEQARPGHTVHMPPPPSPEGRVDPSDELVMRVSEVHTAKLVSAEGELPFAVRPGDPVRYVDLSGPKRTFGTLDYGAPGDKEVSGFVGREVELNELKLDLASAMPAQGPRVKSARMECPQCHGALELRAPDATQRVACPYCGTLSDATKGNLRALSTLKPAAPPPIALGSAGTLLGTKYQVIGHARRRIAKSGFVFDEYVLAAGEGGSQGFHYLVEAGGHFTRVRPAHLGDIRGKGNARMYEGEEYLLAETCTTEVSSVLGEFPWAVELGEKVEVKDFARPGKLLSLETALGERKELNVSVGEYVEPAEVYQAFAVKAEPPRRTYVAPHQPNPHSAAYERHKPIFAMASVGVVLLMVIAGLLGGGRRTTHSFPLQTVPGVEPAAEHVYLSEPFDLGRRLLGGQAAVKVELQANVNNSWLGTDLALINDETGESFLFGAEVGYYSGYADGESYSEGTRRYSLVVPSVPAGRYVLRVEPSWPVERPCDTSQDCAAGNRVEGLSWSCVNHRCSRACVSSGSAFEGAGCSAGTTCINDRCVVPEVSYTVTLTYGVTRLRYGVLVLMLLLAVPLFTLYRRNRFEQRRKEDMDE